MKGNAIFKVPENKKLNYEEKAKFNFVWRINIVFVFVCFLMSIVTFLADDFFFRYYVVVSVITTSALFLLSKLKDYILVSKILYSSICIVIAIAIFQVPESLHLQESIWIIVIVLAAFFTISNTWGVLFLVVNSILFFCYYNFAFAGTAYLSLTIRPNSLFILSVEFCISMFVIGFIMYQFVHVNNYAKLKMSAAYNALKEEKQIVEYQNKEKTVLLQEIHHRVKNNMQVIVSLLRLQSGEVKSEEAKASFYDAITRIHTMSLIHQKMYEKESLINIDVEDYLFTLISNLVGTGAVNKDIKIKVESKLSVVSSNTIVPLGLIVSELVSNSIKHAFEKDGAINLTVEPAEGDQFKMTYHDDGTWKEPKANTFGTQLIDIFVDQVEGTYKRDITDSGTYYYFELMDEKEVE